MAFNDSTWQSSEEALFAHFRANPNLSNIGDLCFKRPHPFRIDSKLLLSLPIDKPSGHAKNALVRFPSFKVFRSENVHKCAAELSVSPSQRMPRDIWENIFIFCLPSETFIQPQTNAGALLLCRVCHAWRELALSTPLLWTSLSVVVGMGKSNPPINVIEDWLDLSGALPLSLSIHQSNNFGRNCTITSTVLNTFIRYSARWKHVRIDLAGPPPSPPCQILNAPHLETLDLNTAYSAKWRIDELFALPDSAPRLSCLSVSRIPSADIEHNGISGGMVLPWAQLTSISVDSIPSVRACLGILKSCVNLAECTFRIDSFEIDSVAQAAVTTHASLQTLTLSVLYEGLPFLLDHLALPGLRTLAIDAGSQHPWPHDAFAAFLTRSACALRALELRDTNMHGGDAQLCVQHPCLAGLRSLVITERRSWLSSACLTPALLALLTHCAARCLLPELEALEIRDGFPRGVEKLLVSMIESRWRVPPGAGVAQLRCVGLELHGGEVEDILRLERMRQEGLEWN